MPARFGALREQWERVEPSRRPVLLINPRSGGGKAARAALADRARERGVEPVVLGPTDDLATLIAIAVDKGADALGMAGGDGSLATVAAAAAEHDLPFICLPAGTRNHFALDLGIVRHDLLGALDAFTAGLERRIDTARGAERPSRHGRYSRRRWLLSDEASIEPVFGQIKHNRGMTRFRRKGRAAAPSAEPPTSPTSLSFHILQQSQDDGGGLVSPESASRQMDASSVGALVTLAGAPFGYVAHRLSETARSDC